MKTCRHVSTSQKTAPTCFSPSARSDRSAVRHGEQHTGARRNVDIVPRPRGLAAARDLARREVVAVRDHADHIGRRGIIVWKAKGVRVTLGWVGCGEVKVEVGRWVPVSKGSANLARPKNTIAPLTG